MASVGRTLIVLGLLLAGIGVSLLLGGRLGLGRLPGDFVLRRGVWAFAFPLATSLLVSLALTLLLNVVFRRR